MGKLKIASLLVVCLLLALATVGAVSSISGQTLAMRDGQVSSGDSSAQAQDFLIGLGNVAVREGKIDIAKKFFGVVAAHGDGREKAMAYHNLGVLAYDEEDFAVAQSFFQSSVEADSSYAEGEHSLALISYHMKDFEVSIAAFNEYLDMVPDDAGAHFDRGVVLADAVRFAGFAPELLITAREDFVSTLQLDADFPHAEQNAQILSNILSDAGLA